MLIGQLFTRYAALALAGSFVPAVVTAQIGRLRPRVPGAAADKAAKPPAEPSSGMARVTAVIDWTVESSTVPAEWAGDMSWTANMRRTSGLPDSPLGPNTFTPASVVDNERGSVTLQLDMDPNDLPGGPQSRLLGGRTSLGLTQGQPMLSGSRLVSLTGSVSLDRSIRPIGTCDRRARVSNSMPVDPPTATLSGKREYTPSNTDINLSFVGDKPVSVSVTRTAMGAGGGVHASGRGAYACGGAFVARDTENVAGMSLLVMEGTTWVTQAQPTSAGYLLSGRAEEKSQGWRVVRTVKLTWTAPRPPQGQVAGGAPPPNVAEQMKFESGKGSITFTQGGKQATWPLSTVNNTAMPGGGSSVTMMYTPDGGTPSEEKGVLALSIASVMGQTMVGLNVTKGPGGDAAFEAEHCSAKSTTTAGKTQGSGECRDGGIVVRFTFTAAGQP